jgi:hypothetical protein
MIYCIYRDVCAAPKSLFLHAFAQTTLSMACQFLQQCRKFASRNQNLNEVAPGSCISSGRLLLEWMKSEQSMQPARHACRAALYSVPFDLYIGHKFNHFLQKVESSCTPSRWIKFQYTKATWIAIYFY